MRRPTPVLDKLIALGFAKLYVATKDDMEECKPFKVRIKKPSKKKSSSSTRP